ncbi:uncharacterized protein LOC106647910 [Copidosoma floridanum]|uniref:uncharacterized protein LOC106647910 n=1 Tax=Copidosoma floridanum TaxID=29053 RepID=UPI0006C96AAF|nr:uncharacterized protein LOC106647910 [Copidosoma floridanum]
MTTAQSHDVKDCNRRLEKLMKKTKKEIVKVDQVIKNCNKTCQGPMTHVPSKDEKKQLIDSIKQSSSALCNLLEELKKHRTEVKCLLNAFDKLTKKHEKLKLTRQNQLEQLKDIHNYVKSELSPLIKVETTKASGLDGKNRDEENEKLEKTLEDVVSQYSELLKECKRQAEFSAERAKRIQLEDENDKILFGLVLRCIRKAFNIRANIECKRINFVDYIFPDGVQDEDQECD